MKLHIYPSKEILSESLAAWMCDLIKETLSRQEFFTLVLSGGDTPKLLFKKLASDSFKDKIDWKRIHIFWGDERVVPFTDERNNAKMAVDNLLSLVPVPEKQIHKMRTDIEPNFSVLEYREILHSYFDNTYNSFDLVLLGLGDDGHTLSLFPGSSVLDDNIKWVNEMYLEKQAMYRITLMPAIVNKATHIAFMVAGSNKSETVRQVIEGEYQPEILPSQMIKAPHGELHWFLDEDAASELNQK